MKRSLPACGAHRVCVQGVAAVAFVACFFQSTALVAQTAFTPEPLQLAQAAQPVAAPTATTNSAALQGSATRTHFVIGLEKPTQPHVYTLANPNRVVVDLPDVKLQLPIHSGDKPVGLVASFRGGLAEAGKMRVIIDVIAPSIVEGWKFEPAPGGRGTNLVIEIVPIDAVVKGTRQQASLSAPSGLGAVGVQPPTPRPAQAPKKQDAKAYKPLIVLDPGHGGHDSGAIKWGTVEKDVVLAFSKTLRQKLEATGRYRVMMTRDRDVFVDLDRRREIAEENNAALFIAVHADYAGSKARGATIYSLKQSVANDLKRSAKGEVSENVLSAEQVAAIRQIENKIDSQPGRVREILADLAQREVDVTRQRTSVLTRSVVEFMGTATNLQNNPDRSATYRVLKTAKVPAVLIELAYVTNQQDAKNLKSEEWRSKVANSIMTAIDNYFSNQIARLPM